MFNNLDFSEYINYMDFYNKLFTIEEAGYKEYEKYLPIIYYRTYSDAATETFDNMIFEMASSYNCDNANQEINSFLHYMFKYFLAEIVQNNINVNEDIIKKLRNCSKSYISRQRNRQSVLFFEENDELELNKCKTDDEIEAFCIKCFVKKINDYFKNWEPVKIRHYIEPSKETLKKIITINLKIANLQNEIKELEEKRENLLKGENNV